MTDIRCPGDGHFGANRQKINSLLLDAVPSQLSFVLRGFVLETEPFLTTRREADYRRSMSCNTNHTVGAAERRACMVIVSTSVPKISKFKLDRLRLTGSPRCDRAAEMGYGRRCGRGQRATPKKASRWGQMGSAKDINAVASNNGRLAPTNKNW